MEGMGLKLTPVIARCLLGHLNMFGLWLALLAFTASPNSPNRGFNLPPAIHPPLHLSPTHLPTPYNVPSVILQWFCKKWFKIQ